MRLVEFTGVVTIDTLFEQMDKDFRVDISQLNEVDLNPDGSIPWEAPTPAEKKVASNIVPQHGRTGDWRQQQKANHTPVVGDFVFFPDTQTVGVVAQLDVNSGHVNLVDRTKKPIGTFNIKDLWLTGQSQTPYKTVYGMFKDVLVRPIANPESMVKRFVVSNEINI